MNRRGEGGGLLFALNLRMSRLACVFLCLFCISLPALAVERAKIVTCVTTDSTDEQYIRDMTKDLPQRTKFSGLVLTDSSQFDSLVSINLIGDRERAMGRDWADLINAHIISSQMVQNGVCALVEGDVFYRSRITPDFFPSPDPTPIPREALNQYRFFIPLLTAGILEDSAWTQNEVHKRLQSIRALYAQCAVDIDAFDIKIIPNPDHGFDNIKDDMEPRDSLFVLSPFEKRMQTMLASTQIQAPALLYLKNVWQPGISDGCSLEARAFISEKIVPKNSPIAGMALITETYSNGIQKAGVCGRLSGNDKSYFTDAHELGHLLLYDGGHVNSQNNLMYGFPSETEGRLNEDQCAAIRASPFVYRQKRN